MARAAGVADSLDDAKAACRAAMTGTVLMQHHPDERLA
jgi:hypothetical protein